MINKIKQEITNRLITTCPTIYDEDIPQNFVTPSFLISVIEQDYEKRINLKYKSQIFFDIAYFSDKNKAEIKEDCLKMQEKLLREFDLVGGFRALSKKANITDNVLHFMFDITYSEILIETENKMETHEIHTRKKGE